MRPERWIPFSELHEATYEPLTGIFDALYTLAPRLQLCVVSKPIVIAREWIQLHDAQYRETCSHLQEALSQTLQAGRRVQFYTEVLHAAPLAEVLQFMSTAPLGVRMSRFSLLRAIPMYLKHAQ